mgnify:CR=1 FL=1
MFSRNVIVMEGPDGGGKSTAAELLSRALGFPVIHTGGPLRTRVEFDNRVIDKRLMFARNCIFDRSPFLSEHVYSRLRTSPALISMEETLTWLRMLKPLVIYCTLGDSETMRGLMLATHESKPHKSLEHVREVWARADELHKAYTDLMKQIPPPQLLVYDWTAGTSPSEFVETVRARLGEFACAV